MSANRFVKAPETISKTGNVTESVDGDKEFNIIRPKIIAAQPEDDNDPQIFTFQKKNGYGFINYRKNPDPEVPEDTGSDNQMRFNEDGTLEAGIYPNLKQVVTAGVVETPAPTGGAFDLNKTDQGIWTPTANGENLTLNNVPGFPFTFSLLVTNNNYTGLKVMGTEVPVNADGETLIMVYKTPGSNALKFISGAGNATGGDNTPDPAASRAVTPPNPLPSGVTNTSNVWKANYVAVYFRDNLPVSAGGIFYIDNPGHQIAGNILVLLKNSGAGYVVTIEGDVVLRLKDVSNNIICDSSQYVFGSYNYIGIRVEKSGGDMLLSLVASNDGTTFINLNGTTTVNVGADEQLSPAIYPGENNDANAIAHPMVTPSFIAY